MMWINVVLALMLQNPQAYFAMVKGLNSQGCRVYDAVYVSCPGVVPIGAVPIPADAVEVVPIVRPSRQSDHAQR